MKIAGTRRIHLHANAAQDNHHRLTERNAIGGMMTRLIRLADWDGGVRLNVVFVHGLGGHGYDTWRRAPADDSFWPVWLSRDIPGVATWTLSYDAPASNWLGTAMPIQDRARNLLEALLGEPALRDAPLVFACHSLGGLMVKQLLRVADGKRGFGDAEAGRFIDRVAGVVFIATPHTGSLHATLLDRLRLIAWPSASALDLVKGNAALRDLNIWYRNWPAAIRNKVFTEKRGTSIGVIVDDESGDPGLLHVEPVPVDADHVMIAKPVDAGDVVYTGTRKFLTDTILAPNDAGRTYGANRQCDLPVIRHGGSSRFLPIGLRVALIGMVALIGFKGIEAVFFPPDPLSAASIEQIQSALRLKTPSLTPAQIDQFIRSLREARGDPSFERAVTEARKGNTRIA